MEILRGAAPFLPGDRRLLGDERQTGGHEEAPAGEADRALEDPRARDQLLQPALLRRSEEHTSELQSRGHVVCRLLLEKKNTLEIDFDARASEREFYRAILLDLRRVLPASMPLSITALASLCECDGWISGIPVTEAVPM